MPPSSPTPKSRPDTHLPHRGRGQDCWRQGSSPSHFLGQMFPNQVQRRRPALSCRADSRVACETQGDMGKGVSGGATRKPRDESGQARAAPPPPVGGGVEIAPSFPSSPRPWHPGFQFCSLESCPCFQGFCVSEGEDTKMGETTGRGAPSVQRGEQSGNFHSRKTSATSLPSHGGLGAGEQGRGPWAPTADTY